MIRRCALLAVLLATLACIGGEERRRAVPGAAAPPSVAGEVGGLAAVAEPPLERLEPAVREQLQQVRQLVRELEAEAAPPDRLAVAYGKLGRVYHAYEFFDAARDGYRQAIARQPEDFRWHYYLAQSERAAGELERAVAAFEAALELRADDPPALFALAQVYRELLQPERAEGLARRLLEHDPKAAGAHLVLANLADDRRDFGAAVTHYRAVLAVQPAATKIHLPLALALRGLGRLEEAQEHLAQRGDGTVAVADSLMAELRRMRTGARADVSDGVAAFQSGDYRRAAAAFERAVAADPESASARLDLGSALAELGDLEAAIAEYREAVRLDPGDALAHFNLGTALARRGDDVGAVRHYRLALEVDPEAAGTRFNLGNALRRQGRCGEALEHYRWLVERDPGNGSARLAEAVCLVEERRFKVAAERLAAARRAFPKSPSVADVRARFLAACPRDELRDGALALRLAQQLVGLEQSPRYLETLAMARAEVGRFEAAVEAQRAAIAAAGSGGIRPRLERNLKRYLAGKPCREPAVGD